MSVDKLPTGPTVVWTPAENDMKYLMYDAYKFDDKPHRLFSNIRRLASKYAPSLDIEEIQRLMDIGYSNAWKIFNK